MTVEQILALRRQRWTGQQIAWETGVSPAAVSRILRAAKLSRIRDLEPPELVVGYGRDKPCDMIHLDIEKLGRLEKIGHRIIGDRTGQSNPRGRKQGYGWEFVHVCMDDNSRVSFSHILPDEKAVSATAFLKAALAYCESLAVAPGDDRQRRLLQIPCVPRAGPVPRPIQLPTTAPPSCPSGRIATILALLRLRHGFLPSGAGRKTGIL